MAKDFDLGNATSYSYYVSEGGTKSPEEFGEMLVNIDTVATRAEAAASGAAESEENADQSKTAAQAAAGTATTKATEASQSATAAANAASAAQADADAAALDASQAMSAASTATSKATEAASSASTATAAKTDAVTAKTAAQAAQTAAETAEDNAETSATAAAASAASVAGCAAQITQNAADINELKSDLTKVLNSDFDPVDISANDTVAKRGISVSGAVQYDADKTTSLYPVNVGDILYLSLSANTGSASTVWVFTTNTTVGSLSAGGVVGSIHSGAFTGFVTVPAGATHIAIAQDTGANFTAQRLIPKPYETQIKYISDGAYETLKGSFAIGSILNGSDTTTTTRVRHVSPISYDHDVTLFIKSGFKCYIAFYTDATGATYKTTTSGFYTSDTPIIIGKNQYFRICVMKSTEETVTDIDTYIKAFFVTTQLFDDPHIYKNVNIRQIAHQGINVFPVESTGHNLAESYDNAARLGFTHGETDVLFTSDGIPVCSHDRTFTDLDSGTTITISEHTYTELQTYNYHGSKISSFEDVVKTCKMYGLGLYIDHLDGSWTNAEWQSLFDIVQKYCMTKNVVWLIPSLSTLLTDPIRAWDANASFTYVLTTVPTDFATVVSTLDALKTETNTVSIDLNCEVISAQDMPIYTSQLTPNVDLEIWAVDGISEWRAYLPYVVGITSNKICANIARVYA